MKRKTAEIFLAEYKIHARLVVTPALPLCTTMFGKEDSRGIYSTVIQ